MGILPKPSAARGGGDTGRPLAGRALIDLLGAAMLKPGISLEQAKAEL